MLCFSSVSFFSGCTDVVPNLVWSGVLVDAGVTDAGSSWVKLNSSGGVINKIWGNPYPILNDLVRGEFYSFHSYVNIGIDGNIISPLRLVYIEDESGVVVWG